MSEHCELCQQTSAAQVDRCVIVCVDDVSDGLLQILYKDSEHVDSAAAETDTAANTDDGGASFRLSEVESLKHLF